VGLLTLINKFEHNNINLSIFREPDMDNQVTAVALEPTARATKLCSNLPLALKEYSSLKN
jgi:hypothetical protein